MNRTLRILITEYNKKTVVILEQEHTYVDIRVFDPESDDIGSIYLGRVSKILSNIDSCFVVYGKDKTGFLKSNNYKVGQIIPVMIRNENIKDKKVRLSDRISLTSDYFVISEGTGRISLSSRLESSDRMRLKTFMTDTAMGSDKSLDVLVRTAAATKSDEFLKEQFDGAKKRFEHVLCLAQTRCVYSKIYEPESEFVSYIRECINRGYNNIITDKLNLYEQVSQTFCENGDVNIEHYDDSYVPFNVMYKLDAFVSSLLNHAVNLKSGANITIEPTEAFVSIDVNTSGISQKGSCEETFLNTNIEAAYEIARQLRLRNLSGIIIIDFINMKHEESYDRLSSELTKALENDCCKSKIEDITALKLYELTRRRIRKPLYEQLR